MASASDLLGIGDRKAVIGSGSGMAEFTWNGTVWVPAKPEIVSYTPNLSNVTIGTNGSVQGAYQVVGGWVSGWAEFVLGSGGTPGSVSGNIAIGVPFARAATANAAPLGQVYMRDVSVPTGRIWAFFMNATTSSNGNILNTLDGSIAGASAPWVWAPGDYARVQYHYPIA